MHWKESVKLEVKSYLVSQTIEFEWDTCETLYFLYFDHVLHDIFIYETLNILFDTWICWNLVEIYFFNYFSFDLSYFDIEI